MRDEAEIAGLEVSPQMRLCQDLDRALHAMAQPLTVLRGALGALTLASPSVSDGQRYLQVSNRQVERLCSLMSSMRFLLDSVQADPEVKEAHFVEKANLPELVHEATQDAAVQNERSMEQVLVR